MEQQFSRDMFEQHLRSLFQLEHAHPAVSGMQLELVTVTSSIRTNDFEAFSIVFRGPQQPRLPQGIYHLRHAELGAIDLFIVPIRQEQDGLYYEAVFNFRLTAAQA